MGHFTAVALFIAIIGVIVIVWVQVDKVNKLSKTRRMEEENEWMELSNRRSELRRTLMESQADLSRQLSDFTFNRGSYDVAIGDVLDDDEGGWTTISREQFTLIGIRINDTIMVRHEEQSHHIPYIPLGSMWVSFNDFRVLVEMPEMEENITMTLNWSEIVFHASNYTSGDSEELHDDRVYAYHKTKQITKDLSNGCALKVGYEVEKNKILITNNENSTVKYARQKGDVIGSFPIFRGYETDSSCGLEAITNILPLSSNEESLKHVKALIEEAKTVIDSPSDSSCGGHINISAEGYNGRELLVMCRANLSILYPLYKSRLKKSSNKSLRREGEGRGVVSVKKKLIEIRLPSRVIDTKQLFLRHRLMAVIMEHSLKHKYNKYKELLKKVEPILLEMYNNNHQKVKNTLKDAKLFRNYILNDEIHDDVKDCLLKDRGNYDRLYTNSLADFSASVGNSTRVSGTIPPSHRPLPYNNRGRRY